MMCHLLELKEHLSGLQRIAANLEEVVVHADVRAFQEPLPDLCDRNFQDPGRLPSGIVGLANVAESCERETLPVPPTGRLSTIWTSCGLWKGASRS